MNLIDVDLFLDAGGMPGMEGNAKSLWWSVGHGKSSKGPNECENFSRR